MIVAGVEAEMSPHLGCFAHTLYLASQKAFKVDTVATVMGKVRKIVGFLHRSTRAAAILYEQQRSMNMENKKLIHDVSTCWNSLLDMLERSLELEPAVSATLASKEIRRGNEECKNTIDDSDLSDAEAIVKLIKEVKLVTTVLCEDEHPTLSMIAPTQVKHAKHFVASPGDTKVIAAMKVFRDDF